MILQEVEKLNLQIIDLRLQLLRHQATSLSQNVERLQKEGNAIIQKFCDENNIDIKNTSVDIQTGEVNLLDKKEG